MVYMGSKNRYVKYICPILQKTIDKKGIKIFYDVCVGGGHIIENIKCENKIGIDINEDLINLYNYAINGGIFPEKITREDWDNAKAGKGESWWRALVSFFASYMARGFEGGYALNSKRNFYYERLINFKKQIPLIKDCNFIQGDILTYNFLPNSVIYVDPPYKNTKKYGVSKNFNYEIFWNKIRQLSKDNYVFVSEQKAPNDFIPIWELKTNRNIGFQKQIIVKECLWIYKNGLKTLDN